MKAKHYVGVLAVVALLIPALWAVVHAGDKTNENLAHLTLEAERSSLRGLQGVNVLVENIPPEVERLGLTREAVQIDTELQLRQYGIRVQTKEESRAIPGHPALYINVQVLTNATVPIVAAYIRVEFTQLVLLSRDPTKYCAAPTWHTGVLVTVGRANIGQIRDDVRDRVAKFINDYLAVNPKQPAPKQEDHGSEAKQG